MCLIKRLADLALQRSFYKLSTPLDPPLHYPNQTQNVLEALPFPLLDQSSKKVILRSLFTPELDEKNWIIRYLGMANRNEELLKSILKTENYQVFTKYSQYAKLLETFREEQPKDLKAFKIPGTVSLLGN